MISQNMYYYRSSNTTIGCLNLVSLLASIPIIGAGLWMARSTATCESSLQTPLLILGFIILVVSLTGFIGSCFYITWTLWLYLFAMLLLTIALLGIATFGLIVTVGGGGVPVTGRVYKEYRLAEYNGWLRKRVEDAKYWSAASACVEGSKTCSSIESWTPMDYMQRDLTSIQSGCCKPPTSCNYNNGQVMDAQDGDCYKWNNAPNVLCYSCDSCKAGVLEQIRIDWHKLTVLNSVVLVVLIILYVISCCVFRYVRLSESQYPYGGKRNNPGWEDYWWRWWNDRRPQRY